MRITTLVENTSRRLLPVEHGLSLHIALKNGINILFDMGQSGLFVSNAVRLGINLANVDMAVISHGHYDHGGGLREFLQINQKAKVFLNRHAFEPHYSLRTGELKYIGLDQELKACNRVILCGDFENIHSEVILFAHVESADSSFCGNRLLFGPQKDVNDDFRHEQNLIVKEGDKTVLFAGCAHCGIINIMQKAESVAKTNLTHVVAGMHLMKSGLTEELEDRYITDLAVKLKEYNGCRYFTMHCSGIIPYRKLRQKMGRIIEYLSCGDCIVI